jgi:hypothetical protein
MPVVRTERLSCSIFSLPTVRRLVFCNRRLGLRLETAWWEEDAELLAI